MVTLVVPRGWALTAAIWGGVEAAERTVTGTPIEAAPRLPLSSTARVIKVTVPEAAGVQVYVQVVVAAAVVSWAGCHVVLPSSDTSTPATTPPPKSVAVPVTV